MTPEDACLICGVRVPDYEPKYCCSGNDCGCMGLPTEPCVCSEICWEALMVGIGSTYEERRIAARIEKRPYVPTATAC